MVARADMPLQNRVDPFAVIHAVPQRGMFMGNRGGCFHDENKPAIEGGEVSVAASVGRS